MTVGDIKWVAGFLEGEGSFQYHNVCRASACQVQWWPLGQLVLLIGGKIYPKKPQRHNQSPAHTWEIQGAPAAGLMMTLFPLLSPRRRKQIRVALNKWNTAPALSKYRVACPRGHAYVKRKHKRICLLCLSESSRRHRRKFGGRIESSDQGDLV